MAEDVRVQIRKHHQTSVKKGKYEKRSVELDEVRRPCLWYQRCITHTSCPLVSKVVRQARCRGRQDFDADEKGDWEQVDHPVFLANDYPLDSMCIYSSRLLINPYECHIQD